MAQHLEDGFEDFESQISKEILEMHTADQELRERLLDTPWTDADIYAWAGLHARNNDRLRAIIVEIGWPTKSRVGMDASNAAWLIAQHADNDVEFQKHCLEHMGKEPESEVSHQHIAFLYDRICINENRPQYFGTQFTTDENGAHIPMPIEDQDNVDARRVAIGMDTIAEYSRHLDNIS